MAAGRSAELGQKVLLIEKMNIPGRKLSITGKGRCNLTNTAPIEEFVSKIEPNGRFLRGAFNNFFNTDLMDFMNRIGVEVVTERGGRVFPKNGSAPEISHKLTDWCKKSKVIIETNTIVNHILVNGNEVVGIKASIKKKNKVEEVEISCKKVILSTGGASYPSTGSTGDGYTLAKSLGHSVTQIYPVLVPLCAPKAVCSKLNGLDLRNVEASVYANNKLTDKMFGEMGFTDFGINGPIILSLSMRIVPLLKQNMDIELCIDLKPALNTNKLDMRLQRDFSAKGKESLHSILNGLLPKKIIPLCLSTINLDANKLGNQLSAKDRKKLLNWIKGVRVPITGHRSFKEAIVTAGGIPTNEIMQKSMESKFIKGLHFAGEVIDLHGPTGGFNLQIAFSTAWQSASF